MFQGPAKQLRPTHDTNKSTKIKRHAALRPRDVTRQIFVPFSNALGWGTWKTKALNEDNEGTLAIH